MKFLGIFLPIFALSTVASVAATTNTYHLNFDLSLNGQHVSSPEVSLKEGSTGTITQKIEMGDCFIEVVPSESTVKNHPGILMKFTIGTIGKNGVRTVISKARALLKENDPAKITVDKLDGRSEKLLFSVTAERKSI